MFNMIGGIVERGINQNVSEEDDVEERINIKGLTEYFFHLLQGEKITLTEEELKTPKKEDLIAKLTERISKKFELKEKELEAEKMREIERVILLRIIDQKWTDHIDNMDKMRQGISLRAYAQRDPLVEYKFLSYDMFEEMSDSIQLDTMKTLLNVRITQQPEERQAVSKTMSTNRDETLAKRPTKRAEAKVGRNDPCPCGSGNKYKFCCGR